MNNLWQCNVKRWVQLDVWRQHCILFNNGFSVLSVHKGSHTRFSGNCLSLSQDPKSFRLISKRKRKFDQTSIWRKQCQIIFSMQTLVNYYSDLIFLLLPRTLIGHVLRRERLIRTDGDWCINDDAVHYCIDRPVVPTVRWVCGGWGGTGSPALALYSPHPWRGAQCLGPRTASEWRRYDEQGAADDVSFSLCIVHSAVPLVRNVQTASTIQNRQGWTRQGNVPSPSDSSESHRKKSSNTVNTSSPSKQSNISNPQQLLWWCCWIKSRWAPLRFIHTVMGANERKSLLTLVHIVMGAPALWSHGCGCPCALITWWWVSLRFDHMVVGAPLL